MSTAMGCRARPVTGTLPVPRDRQTSLSSRPGLLQGMRLVFKVTGMGCCAQGTGVRELRGRLSLPKSLWAEGQPPDWKNGVASGKPLPSRATWACGRGGKLFSPLRTRSPLSLRTRRCWPRDSPSGSHKASVKPLEKEPGGLRTGDACPATGVHPGTTGGRRVSRDRRLPGTRGWDSRSTRAECGFGEAGCARRPVVPPSSWSP